MICPVCKHDVQKVLSNRRSKGGLVNRRRRECEFCAHRWTTYELDAQADPELLKKVFKREEQRVALEHQWSS